MKKQVCGLLMLAAVTAWASPLLAQAPAAPAASKLGTINIQRAIFECNEGKKAVEKLQSQFSPRQNELQAKQAEIDRLQKQLRDQERTLNDEARASLVRQIELKTKEFTRSREDATNEFEQAQTQVFNEIGQKVMKVLDDYARKNGFHVVMDVGSPQSPVLWANSAVDVTDDIIKLYNAAPPAAPAATGSAAPAPAVRPPAAGSPTAAPAARPPVTSVPAAKKPTPAPSPR